jgi:MFS family permease
MAWVAIAQSPAQALVGVVPIGIAAGIFLAVDWALMTDIIPKAESGRYMGISNVVTGAAGALAAAIGLVIVDFGNRMSLGLGPRLAFGVACSYYVIGALLLRPVDERRREDAPQAAATGAISPEPAL